MSTNDDDSSSGSAEVVDFDALNAALGALPPPPTSSSPMIAESQGRSSATYSSARPHTIPPSHAPAEDPNAPAVIVKPEDTLQTGPPAQMTLPMGQGVVSSGAHPVAPVRPPSPSSPTLPNNGPSSDHINLTLPMPKRPRKPRTPTLVVRTRGPTKGQKILVFIAMLVVFVAGGIAFLVIYKPPGLNLDLLLQLGSPRQTASPTSSTPGALPSPGGAANNPSPTSSAAVTGSVRKATPKPR